MHTDARKKPQDERNSITHKFSVENTSGYLIVGMYEDGKPCEIFVHIAKEGSTVGGMMDAWAITMSIALQYGVPLEVLCGKMMYQRFEPRGLTHNKDIPQATSIVDYIAKWLAMKFLGKKSFTEDNDGHNEG